MIKFTSSAEERAFLTHRVQFANDSHKSILFAALYENVALSVFGPDNTGFLSPVTDRPALTLISDDDGTSYGPQRFAGNQLRRHIMNADHAFILAWTFDTAMYAAASIVAALHRQNVVFLETRLAHEQEWISHINAINEGIRFLIATPEGGRA